MKTDYAHNIDRVFLYFALIIIFLTSFPLAQGWLPFGDFRPRVLLIGIALFLYPKCFFSRDLIWLYLFFLFQVLTYELSDLHRDFADWSCQLMEFLVPIIVASAVVFGRESRRAIFISRYAKILTFVTIILTLRVVKETPDIIRNMVTISAWEGIDAVRNFWRLGVCNYSFALIMMCIPPVFLQCSINAKWGVEQCLCLFGTFFVLYFVYVSQVTTTFFLCILMLLLIWGTRKMSLSVTFIWVIALCGIVVLSLNVAVQFLMSFLGSNSEIGLHVKGIYEFISEGKVSSDAYAVDGRVELYKKSITVFLKHPFFGNVTEEIGGHNYVLDNLARFGIIGSFPLFCFFYHRIRITLEHIPGRDRKTYAICVIGFIIMACFKHIAGIDHWSYLFLYIPCFLNSFNAQRES